MTLRTRLLLAFLSIALLVILIFGSLAYRIAQDAGMQREMVMLDGYAHSMAHDLAKQLPEKVKEADLLAAMPVTPDARYLFLTLRDGDLIATSQPMHEYFGADYADFPLSDLRDEAGHGNFILGGREHIWSRADVPGDAAQMIVMYRTHADTAAPLQKLGVRLSLAGLFLIWLAVWGALITSAYITRRLDKQHAAIVHQALHDDLTDLPNRSLLFDRLNQCITLCAREGRQAALLLMDLDRFKEVNDTLGHSSGDALLQQVAKRMRSLLRASDTIARLGGDEFAILLPNADAQVACHVADKIIAAMSQPFVIDGMLLEMDISIGIAHYPEHGDDGDALIRRADVAMYHAKRGGTGFAVYGPETDPHSLRRLVLAGDLRHAIDNQELQLFFQPKLEVRSGELIGVEALLRWKHKEFGMVPPDEFVGIAEQSGLIKQLTHWVLQEGVRQHAAWRDEGIHINMAVNLSVRNLQDRQLPQHIAELLSNHGVPPSALTLEITESAVMSDPKHSLAVLGDLHDMGVKLSIDDFGTGHSSLSYLKRLPVHEIKIDRSFVMDMASDEEDKVIVSTIVALAHNIGLKVVAEGVENRGVLECLARYRCDSVQGYHISRPVPDAELRQWYHAHKAEAFAVNPPVLQMYPNIETFARGA